MTQWKIAPEYRGNAGYLWSREWMETFDLSKLDVVRLDAGSGAGNSTWWGHWYPPRPKKGLQHRISCHVAGPPPFWNWMWLKPLYRNEDGTWPPIPEGVEEAGYSMNGRTGKQWMRVRRKLIVATVEEAVVVIMAHEGFHFLRGTRQVDGRNVENAAAAFEVLKLEEWRRL